MRQSTQSDCCISGNTMIALCVPKERALERRSHIEQWSSLSFLAEIHEVDAPVQNSTPTGRRLYNPSAAIWMRRLITFQNTAMPTDTPSIFPPFCLP